jgi:N-acetylmuramoyl-L-alanine amidase
VLAEPDRVIVELPEVNFQLDPSLGKKPPAPRLRGGRLKTAKTANLVSSYRFGLFAPGRSRVVIDLGAPARILRAKSEPGTQPDTSRLVIELARSDRASFRTAAEQARAENLEATGKITDRIRIAAKPVQKPIIVIDPGHGGVDSGAIGPAGAVEKFIVFEFAKVLKAKLEKRYQVILTRPADVFISLGERVRIARDANAALFVSIHADVLPNYGDVTGATVYTVSDRASDAEAARVAEKENQSDTLAGLEGQEDKSEVTDILFDLTRRETRTYSHVFAHTLVNYWKVAGRLNKNPVRSAGFKVLKAPDVPSVLLELGYLSSDKDSSDLSSAEWQEKTTQKVADAIDKFFSSRTAEAPATAAIDPSEATASIPVAPASEAGARTEAGLDPRAAVAAAGR